MEGGGPKSAVRKVLFINFTFTLDFKFVGEIFFIHYDILNSINFLMSPMIKESPRKLYSVKKFIFLFYPQFSILKNACVEPHAVYNISPSTCCLCTPDY